MKEKIIIFFSISALLFSIIFVPGQASAEALDDDMLENYEELEIPYISEENLEIALEIAESDLEEKAVFINGEFENYYTNYEEANVSENAFNVFNESLILVNQELRNKNLITYGNLADLNVKLGKDKKTGEVIYQPMYSVSTKWYGQVLSISKSEAAKITRILNSGGAFTALYGALGGGIIAGLFAATLYTLGAAGDLCNWYGKGYKVHRAWNGSFWCTPKK